jgi:hypothetical protein
MTPVKTSLPEEHGISTHLVPELAEPKVGIPDPEVWYLETEFVQCFRHEGDNCPRCDGSGFRPRAKCASCGVSAGRPSQGGKALSLERGAKSWKDLRSLPLYCMACNPRFSGAELELFERMGG